MIINSHFKLTDTIRVEYMEVTKLSRATINCNITVRIKGIDQRFHLPSSIAYRLRKRTGDISTFAIAHPMCFAWIGDRIVGVDCPPPDQLEQARKGEWRSVIETNIKNLTVDPESYFDGQYIYTLTADPEVIENNYGVLKVDYCYDMYHCNDMLWDMKPRACFAYQAFPDQWVVTSPVTTAAGKMVQLFQDDAIISDPAVYTAITSVDKYRFVNLRFVNYAAARLSNTFDYETIEPLGLPMLMIEHGTFNLGDITIAVQVVCPAPLSFSQTLAWMIGLYGRVESIEQFIALKETIKMLMTKGCTRASRITDGEDGEDTLHRSEVIDEARNFFDQQTLISFD